MNEKTNNKISTGNAGEYFVAGELDNEETEIEVPSIKEANNLLEALGYAYKSYQEKERITYVLDGYELDIDTWPKIPTYVEVEGKSETDLDYILKKNRLFIRRYSFMYCR